jgi:hypothetical protein
MNRKIVILAYTILISFCFCRNISIRGMLVAIKRPERQNEQDNSALTVVAESYFYFALSLSQTASWRTQKKSHASRYDTDLDVFHTLHNKPRGG